MLFQTANKPVGPAAPVVVTPAQSRAIAVCSSVRVALSDLPSAFTSLKSVAYRSLVSDGGGGGRYCVGDSSAIGAAF